MRTAVTFSVIAILLVASNQSLGQEWSAEQEEVWKTVETYTEMFTKNNEQVMAYFHNDFVGWLPGALFADDLASRQKRNAHNMKTTKTIFYDMKPLSVAVYGDTAVVHYYLDSIIQDSEGKEQASTVLWTDILKKQGDKWLLIGDHGTPAP